MAPYIGILLLLISFGLMGINPNLRHRKIIYFCLVIILIVFAGCRNNGYDWLSYFEIFKGIKKNFNEYSGVNFIEYGFKWLNLLSPSFRVLILITSCFSIWLTLKNVYTFSRKALPLLGLIIFYSTFFLPTYMGQIRQGLAMGIVLVAYKYILQDEKKKGVWLIVIASFFHVTALIALLVAILPVKTKYKLSIYISSFIFAFLSSHIALLLLASILRVTNSGIGDKILFYATTESAALGVTSTILIRIATFILVIVLNKNNDRIITFLSNIYFLGIATYLLLGFAPQLAGRGTYYFSIMEVILVPYLVRCFIKQPIVYIFAYFSVIGLSIYRLISFFSDSYNYRCYIPYF